jgi:protein tyrosine phosphatase
MLYFSAGVGRTGTFIALDILQQMAIKQKSVDIFNCVQRLRNERMLMVQTLVKMTYILINYGKR